MALSGERMRLACWFRRPRRNELFGERRCSSWFPPWTRVFGEGAEDGTRGACAPRIRTRPPAHGAIIRHSQIGNRNQNYDLSLNRYKEVVHAEVAHRPPGEILKALAAVEKEIALGMRELESMLENPRPRSNLVP